MRTTTLSNDEIPRLAIFTLLASAFAPPLEGAGRAPERLDADTAPEETATPAPGLLDRLDAWFWRMEQRSLEKYLAQAKDVHDLEARIRDLERAPLSRYY